MYYICMYYLLNNMQIFIDIQAVSENIGLFLFVFLFPKYELSSIRVNKVLFFFF